MVPVSLPDMYVICGLSFILLGAISLVQPNAAADLPISRHFGWLGAFGLLRGALELLDAWSLAHDATVAGSGVLFVMSFLPLVELARRAGADWSGAHATRLVPLASGWIYAPALGIPALVWATSADADNALRAASRYLLAFPAALVAAPLLTQQFATVAPTTRERLAAWILGVAFACQGVLAGLITEPVHGFSPWLPTHASVLAATGLPVQVPRAVCMIVVILTLSWLVRCRARDIMLREARESREVSASHKLLRTIVDASPDRIFVKDREHRFVMVNRAFAAAQNAVPEQLIGRPDTDFWSHEPCDRDPDRGTPGFHDDDRRVLAGEVVHNPDHPVTLASGSLRLFDTHKRPLRDSSGCIVGVIGYARDITERRQAEAALRIKDQAIRAAITAIVIADMDGRLIYVNPAFVRMWGYGSEQEVLGKTLVDFAEQEDETLEIVRQIRTTGGWLGEIVGRRMDESTFDVQLAASTVTDENGNLTNMMASFLDISERKLVEQALRESEERLRTIIDSVPECVKIVDRDGALLDMNPAGLQLIGAASLDQVRGASTLDLIDPAYRGPYRENIEAVFRGERTVQKFEIIRLDGTRCWGEQHAVPLWSAAEPGRVGSMLAVTRDLTERKRAEEALMESERLLRISMGAVDIAAFRQDIDLRYTWIYRPPPGYTAEQVIGRTDAELLPQADGERVMALKRRTLETGVSTREEVTVTVNGTMRHYELSLDSVRAGDGETIGLIGASLDITSRRQTEDSLRQSERRLRAAQSIARIGNWELDMATGHLWWSDEIYRLFELDPARFGVSYEAFLDTIHPDDRDMVDAAYTESLQNRIPYQITHRLLMADGRIKFVEERCETDYGPDGTPLRSRGTVQDVTVRVEAEELLRHSLHEKEMLVREVHHRVKNNLQIISSLLHFQGKKIKDPAALAVFAEGRNRLRAMILVHEKLYQSHDLLRIDFGEYTLSLARDLYRSYASVAGRVDLVIDIETLALPVEIALPCGMILCELLSNAFKYAFPDDRDGHVVVRAALAERQLALTVADDGVGLPADVNLAEVQSFGWQLITSLAQQVDGQVAVDGTPGTSVTLVCPVPAEVEA